MNETRQSMNTSSSQQPGKRGKAKAVFIGILIALIASVCIGGFVMYQSYQRVRAETVTLNETLGTLEDALTSGNPETLRTTVAKVHDSATTIHNETKGPLWALAENLPNVGNDVKVARTLSDVLLDVSENALNPIADNAELLSPGDLMSNFENLGTSLEQLVTLVRDIHPVITRSVETVDALPTPTFTEIAEAKNQTSEVLTSINDTLDMVEGALSLLESLTS